MSGKTGIKKEVLEFELSQLAMMRKRAKDDQARVIVIAERELEVQAEVEKLEEAG